MKEQSDKTSSFPPLPQCEMTPIIYIILSLVSLAAKAFHTPTRSCNVPLIHCALYQTPEIEGRSNTNTLSSIRPDPSKKRRVVIIGAGVGGLATAARIGKESRGWSDDVEIVVVEKNGKDMIG